jgi:hypothetical protein
MPRENEATWNTVLTVCMISNSYGRPRGLLSALDPATIAAQRQMSGFRQGRGRIPSLKTRANALFHLVS